MHNTYTKYTHMHGLNKQQESHCPHQNNIQGNSWENNEETGVESKQNKQDKE